MASVVPTEEDLSWDLAKELPWVEKLAMVATLAGNDLRWRSLVPAAVRRALAAEVKVTAGLWAFVPPAWCAELRRCSGCPGGPGLGGKVKPRPSPGPRGHFSGARP